MRVVRVQRSLHGSASLRVHVRSRDHGHGVRGEVRPGPERLRGYVQLWQLHRARDLRRRGQSQHLRLHADADGHRLCRQELRQRRERLRRDVFLWDLHYTPSLRRNQCLRLHPDADGDRLCR